MEHRAALHGGIGAKIPGRSPKGMKPDHAWHKGHGPGVQAEGQHTQKLATLHAAMAKGGGSRSGIKR